MISHGEGILALGPPNTLTVKGSLSHNVARQAAEWLHE